MNGQTALNLVMQRLGNRTEPALRSACLEEMKLIARECEDLAWKPWFLFSDLLPLGNLSLNVPSIALGNNFLGLDDEQGGVYYYDETNPVDPYRKLKRKPLTVMKEQFFDEEVAPPLYFDITGNGSNSVLYVRPVPDASYQIYVSGYFRQSSSIADNTDPEYGWLLQAPNLLLAGTTMRMAGTYTREPDVAAANGTLYAAALDALWKETVQRKTVGQDMTMGDD